MIPIGRASARRIAPLLLGLVVGSLLPRPALAQSLTAGALSGRVVGVDGTPIPGAVVIVADELSGASVSQIAGRDGRFSLALLPPGTYSVRAEQAGFQPVRQPGILVRAGQATALTLTIERRPPPIEQIVELPPPPVLPLAAGWGTGPEFGARDFRGFDYTQDITGISRDASIVTGPWDGDAGYARTGGGLPGRASRLYVDGIEEILLRHPGTVAEPAAAPLFSRNAIGGAAILEGEFDTEWDGAPGTILTTQSRGGAAGLHFQPYVTYSGSTLGGRSEDNPADSSASSIQAGAVLHGSIVRDTAQFLLGFNYQTLERPSADPWAQDSTMYDGAGVSLRSVLPMVAADSFGAVIDPYIRPVVRSWRGGNAFGRVDWRLSSSTLLNARAGFSKWKEQDPALGLERESGLGSRLEGQDFSTAATLTSGWAHAANELRMGVKVAKRDWLASGIPSTALVAEGAALGESPLLPASFDQRVLDFTNTFHYRVAAHAVKVGLGLTFTKWKQDYLYGRDGMYRFGDLDRFGNAEGVFFQTVAPVSAVEFSTTGLELFLQDAWTPDPAFQVMAGVRYELQKLPDNEIGLDTAWVNASGVQYNTAPKDNNDFSPRLGFVWDLQGRRTWVLRGGGGIYYDVADLALFSEAALYDGGVTVRRGLGTFAGWPGLPDSAGAPVGGKRLALLNQDYRTPRTTKWDISLSHVLRGGLSLEVSGAYHHSDFLPRREDLNRLPAAAGMTVDGRPVYGTLVQQGGLVTVQPGSNRRFSEFDLVSGISPTGFSDYYGVSVTLARPAVTGLSLAASYTYSRTDDNWLTAASGDPADLLSPFPERTGGSDWADGRSDFDIPHRVSANAAYHFRGRLGLVLGARYRYRSGYPFTPGFRRGVDVNGDGSGGNDPAFLNAAIPGMAQLLSDNGCLADQVGTFADRNSCRDDGQHALDIHLDFGVPAGGMGRIRVMVDAFNVVASTAGIMDHAALLVDPTQSLTVDGAGNVTIPFVANPHFGQLLARRTAPRVVRLGLKVDY